MKAADRTNNYPHSFLPLPSFDPDISAPAKVQARYMRLRLTWQSACIVSLATAAVSGKFNALSEEDKAMYREKHWFLRYM